MFENDVYALILKIDYGNMATIESAAFNQGNIAGSIKD